jgi:MYXO-CTERM domain-containing protein
VNRHPFDVISFAAGLLVSALGVLFAVGGIEVLDHGDWVWPVVLVALGAAGLAASLRRRDAE